MGLATAAWEPALAGVSGRYPDMRVAVSPFNQRNIEAVRFFLEAMLGKSFGVVTDFIICTLGGSNQVGHRCQGCTLVLPALTRPAGCLPPRHSTPASVPSSLKAGSRA
jgi:hypothetical protein